MSKDTAGLHPIDAPGTSERTWTTWPWLSAPPGNRAAAAGLSGLARHAGLARVATAVIVAAHPDDICLAPWDRDMHPDHEAAGRAARRAAPRAPYYYPIWMWHWASPADPRVPWGRALRVPLSPHAAAAKRAAIGCFTSQTRDRGHGLGPVLSPEMIAHFTRTTEVLIQ